MNMILTNTKMVVAGYIFVLGCAIASNNTIHQGYGTKFIAYGVALCFLSVFSGTVSPLHKYAVEKHNRFLLIFCFVVDTFIFSLLIDTGMKMNSNTSIEFPKEMQLDCTRLKPLIYSEEECAPFINSERVAGFRLYWEGYFTDKSNTDSFQVLSSIQGKLCCGFFAPTRCITNTAKFPSQYSQLEIKAEFLKQNTICGNMPGYYPNQDNCLDYYDQAAVPPIIGGCNFDMGVGFCLGKELMDSSLGCVSYVEDYIAGIVGPNAIMTILLSALNFFAMLISCCMYWKRKEGDIFPSFTVDKEGTVDYLEVRHQFVVKPYEKILHKQGYFPEERKEEESKDPDGDGDIELSTAPNTTKGEEP